MKIHFALRIISVCFFCVVPSALLIVACGDGETCIDVSCNNHDPKSTKVYTRCCDQNEEGKTVCAAIIADGRRLQCDDFNCPEVTEAVVAWCKE